MSTWAICVNSHIQNELAVKRLISSLPITDIPVIVVVGQSPETRIERHNGVIYSYVLHNSIDFTGLIYVYETYSSIDDANELPIPAPSYWFYVHDTCEFKTSVFGKWLEIQMATYDGDTQPLTKYPSMNMGVYKHEDILKWSSNLYTLKSIDRPHTTDIHRLKHLGVKMEDFLFKTIPNNTYFSSRFVFANPRDIYGSGVLRIIEYFDAVGMYKYKANWKPTVNYTYRL